MSGQTVTVTMVAGEPETGVWCPQCLLPSAIRTPVTSDTPMLCPPFSVTACEDCDWHQTDWS
jgi:hypothetical protein